MITSLAVYLLNHTPLNVPRMPFATVPVRCWPGLSSLVTLIITCERIFNISSSVCHPKSSPALFPVSLSTTSIRKSSQTLFSPTAFPGYTGKKPDLEIPTLCIHVQLLEDSLSLPS